MKVQKIYLDIFALRMLGAGYLKRHEGKENKLCDAFKAFSKQYKGIDETYEEAVDDIGRNNCITIKGGEKDGAIVYDNIPIKNEKGEQIGVQQKRCFNPEGERKMKAELKALLNKTITVHARIAEGDDVPGLIEKLTDDEKRAFSEIIIPKQDLPAEEE